MSEKFNETINQFKVGDSVRKKGKEQKMTITGNVPGVPNFEHYLKSDKFVCSWIDKDGNQQKEEISGSDLECA